MFEGQLSFQTYMMMETFCERSWTLFSTMKMVSCLWSATFRRKWCGGKHSRAWWIKNLQNFLHTVFYSNWRVRPVSLCSHWHHEELHSQQAFSHIWLLIVLFRDGEHKDLVQGAVDCGDKVNEALTYLATLIFSLLHVLIKTNQVYTSKDKENGNDEELKKCQIQCGRCLWWSRK